jgi:hypothetical protein
VYIKYKLIQDVAHTSWQTIFSNFYGLELHHVLVHFLFTPLSSSDYFYDFIYRIALFSLASPSLPLYYSLPLDSYFRVFSVSAKVNEKKKVVFLRIYSISTDSKKRKIL